MAKEDAKFARWRPIYIPNVGIVQDCGNTVPADGAEGYATGCLFHHLDGSAADALYYNVGSITSADFTEIGDTLSSSELALISTAMIGASELNLVSAAVVAIDSQLLLIESEAADNRSEILVLDSEMSAAQAGIASLESDLLVEKSTVNAVSELLVAIASRVLVLESEMSAVQGT